MLVIEGLSHEITEFVGVFRHVVGEVGVLRMVPDAFDWVEIGCVWREPLNLEPIGALLVEATDGRAMHVQPIANQDDRPPQFTSQLQQELQEVGRFDVVIVDGEGQAQAARARAIGKGGDDGQPIVPVPRILQWRFAARSPGAAVERL